MDENMKNTLASLLVKLSAVRVTLTDAEQSLLDQLILSSPAEAQAMVLQSQSVSTRLMGADEVKAASLASQVVSTRVSDADEVKASALAAQKVSAKMTEADETAAMALKANRLLALSETKVADTDETSAHTMSISGMEKPTFPNPVWVKIVYDPQMERYRLA